jgi:hypothetical protein
MKKANNELLSTQTDPWNTRFGFYWYNDQEIFEYSQEDFNHRAEEFAGIGINHVITFSCTHFRWSFRRYWDQITEAITRIVNACHLRRIAVTEHHSCHLTFNPLNKEDEDYLDRIQKVEKSMQGSWPHLREDCDADPIINNVPLSSFRQIDGRTGNWARTGYHGYAMCFNNPDYRKAYFQYLETIYDTGIDGIMTDDVQYFGKGHACACTHCRKLFKEHTGYDMPQPGAEWNAWHENYNNPSYIAWLNFRFRSTNDFHIGVKSHYESLGLRPLRPNYVSDAFQRNPTAYSLETLPDLDWIFKENCFSDIIRYSWPNWAVESTYFFAVARRKNIPPMSMFYPDRVDSINFCWALAMSWGHQYLATPEGKSLINEEKSLRRFEKKHSLLLCRSERIASIAFYDSRTNKNLYEKAESRSLKGFWAWSQACCRQNIPFDMFQAEELDRLSLYRVVILNETAFLSDKEMNAFRTFVRNGGILVWTGDTGIKDEKGIDRGEKSISQLWRNENVSVIQDGGSPLIHNIGNGKLVMMSGDYGLSRVEGTCHADRWKPNEVRIPYYPPTENEWKIRRKITGFLLDLLPDGPDMEINNLPADVLVTLFETEKGGSLVVHLVNAGGTLDVKPGTEAGHSDPILFPRYTGRPEIRIQVRKPDKLSNCSVKAAYYHDPESDDPVLLKTTDEGKRINIEIDPSLIGFYGLIEITF